MEQQHAVEILGLDADRRETEQIGHQPDAVHLPLARGHQMQQALTRQARNRHDDVLDAEVAHQL